MFSSKRTKLFTHEFFSYEELKTEEKDGKRFYLTPIGPLRSVTTILGEVTDKTWLQEWKDRVGEEEARKILAQAGTRGTAIHKICEDYILNKEDYRKGVMPVNLETFSKIKPYLDEHIDVIYGIEIPLWSPVLRTAGRSDLICQWKKRKSIVDYKTSRRIKSEADIIHYFIQATCYAYMANELYGMDIEQIVIIMSVDGEKTLVFEKNTKEFKKEMLDIFLNQSKL